MCVCVKVRVIGMFKHRQDRKELFPEGMGWDETRPHLIELGREWVELPSHFNRMERGKDRCRYQFVGLPLET